MKSPVGKVGRSSVSGRFLGQASDGTRIVKPSFKPEGFTQREIQKVIREMRQTQQTKSLG